MNTETVISWHYQICLFIVIFGLTSISCRQKEKEIFPEKRDIIESVYSSVIVEPDSLYQAYSSVAGICEKFFVEEGSLVKISDPIAQIRNNTPKLNEENAKLVLEMARENYKGSSAILSDLLKEIDAARLQLNNDSINFFRQQKLWSQQVGSKIELDSRKLKYELSRNNLNLLEQRYQRTKFELETSYKQAQNNLESAVYNSKDFTVTSEIQGKVYAIHKKEGEIVNSMEPLASIGKDSSFVLKLQIDEVDIVKMSKNQEVLITLDAYDGELYKGKIKKIYPQKELKSNAFIVDAIFDNPPKVLYPGLSGEANVIIRKKENALTIPRDFLLENNQVLTRNGLVDVQTGLRNIDFVEILSGLNDETAIIKSE
ncbi:efflux RND transporter periplasmic adaptor subunit [Namhaeicola litoreus]|uniref:Efflux RND transporter periplasmic adaptor subunit n=1 Tax=Namhaeicola litoreus TaxID=1052145 RepID=A0ABW3Y4A4_9FLAO